MEQNEIKLRQNQSVRFEIEDVDKNWTELDDRTRYNDSTYNTIALLGPKVKALVETDGATKDYDVAHYYLVDNIDNIVEENPTEDFLLVKDLEQYYFGQKQTDTVDFKDCRLTIGKQAYKKDFEEDEIIVTLGGYKFWKLDAPLSLDLTSGNNEAAFVYNRKFTSAGVDLVDSLTSTSTTEALTAKQGKILKGFIDAINTLLSSDDTALDEWQEILNFIKQNKEDLNTLTVGNIAGLVTALSTKLEKGNYTGTAEDLFLLIDNFQGFSGDYNDLSNPPDLNNFLKFVAQTLTDPQQTQARENISAVGKNDINPQRKITSSAVILPSDDKKTIFIDGTGIVATIDLVNETYPSNFTTAYNNINDTQDATLRILAVEGWSYKLNNELTVIFGASPANVTFTIPNGSTFTIIRAGSNNTLILNGDVE